MSGAALALATMFACMGLDPVSQLPITTEIAAPDAAAPDVATPEVAASEAPAFDTAEAEPAKIQDAPDADLEFVVTARRHERTGDPLEGLNMKTFAVAQAADTAFVRPAAKTYERIVPEPARMGLRNFFRNLHEPVVFLNFLLQLKPRSAVKTLGRFAVNSTVGAAGLFDMAKKKAFNLPYRRNGFANTLAYYGVKSGPFLFVPLVGPTTLRDLFGLFVDTSTMPATGFAPLASPTYAASSTTVKVLDHRAEDDERIQNIRDGNPNAYVAIRAAYLAQRDAEIAELHTARKPTSVPGGESEPVEVAAYLTLDANR